MITHRLDTATRTLQLVFPRDLLSTNADSSRAQLMEILESEAMVAANWETLQLDLTAAKMVDSVGLNLIVLLYKEAKKRNAATVATISSPNIQRTFLFTRIDSRIKVVMAG